MCDVLQTTAPEPKHWTPGPGNNEAMPSTLADVPTVIDIEASGFGRGSYPIEVGYVLPDGRGYCTLIRPEPGWTHWDGEAERLHGITRGLLQDHGRTALDVARHLNDALAGRTVYTDGWNHDYTWLAVLYDAADAQPSFRLENLRQLLDESEAGRWHDIKHDVEQAQAARRHRASTDARVLQYTLQRLRMGTGTRATND